LLVAAAVAQESIARVDAAAYGKLAKQLLSKREVRRRSAVAPRPLPVRSTCYSGSA
jgi:hypothetical protein